MSIIDTEASPANEEIDIIDPDMTDDCTASSGLRSRRVDPTPVSGSRESSHALHGPAPLGWCECGAFVHAASFRDRLSYREWWLRPACQACQDAVYLASDPSTGERLALRRGAIVVCRDEEFAALPFVFTRAHGPRAWEARYAVRVGARLEPSDPYLDLAPMRSELEGHQISVHCARGCWHDVAHRLGRPALVITLDRSMVCTLVGVAPALRRSACIALADCDVLAVALGVCSDRIVDEVLGGPSRDAVRAGASPVNALESCAEIGAFLSQPVSHGASELLLDRLLPASAG